jgi:hypothetical protein
MKQECNKHTNESYKIRFKVKVRLLHIGLRFTRLRSEECFKR